jgi:hypothetical protein
MVHQREGTILPGYGNIETAVLCDAIFGQRVRGRDSRAYLTRPSVTQETDEK